MPRSQEQEFHTLRRMVADPFEALGLPADFRLSREAVERAYLERSKAVHPDLAAGKDDAARLMAELNMARRLLLNPESRAEVLLGRLGGPAAAEERSLPSGFLAEMMEIREQIEASMAESPDQARNTWETWSSRERARAIEEVAVLFDQLGSSASRRLEVLREIRVRLNAWRYIERLIEQLVPEA